MKRDQAPEGYDFQHMIHTSHRRRQDPLPPGWLVWHMFIHYEGEIFLDDVVVDAPSLEDALRYHNNWRVEKNLDEGVANTDSAWSSWEQYDRRSEWPSSGMQKRKTPRTKEQKQVSETRRRAKLSSLQRALEDFI